MVSKVWPLCGWGQAGEVRRKKRRWVLAARTTGFGLLVRLLFSRQTLWLKFAAFLLGRVTAFDELIPFGLALFLAVARNDRARGLAVALWTMAGMLTVSGPVSLIPFMAVALVFYWYAERGPDRGLSLNLWLLTTLVGSGVLIVTFTHPNLYNYLLVGVNAALVFTLTSLFRYGALLWTNEQRQRLTMEQLISATVLLAAVIAGIGTVTVGLYSLQNVAARCAIMLFTLVGGLGMGAAAGVAVGAVSALSFNTPVTIGLYAFSGLLAGVFQPWKKIGVGLGFIAAHMTLSVYFQQSDVLTTALTETALAFLLFMLIPDKVIAQLREYCQTSSDSTMIQDQVRQETNEKLRCFAAVFQELSAAFSGISCGTSEKMTEQRLNQFMAVIHERLCKQCTRYSQCWTKDYDRTYAEMEALFHRAEANQNFVSPWAKARCVKVSDLKEVVALVIERRQIYHFWQKKVAENRLLLSEHMRGISTIIDDFAREVCKSPIENRQLARLISRKADDSGCPVQEVRVSGEPGQMLRIEMLKPVCGDDQECIEQLEPLISNLTGERFSVATTCDDNGKQTVCRIVLETVEKFAVNTGVATAAKHANGVSGDSYAVAKLDHGRVAVMLSDGMGSGPRAHQESQTTIHLLQQLLASGFELDVAVKTVNSMLLLRAPEESFSTVDLMVVDLFSGKAKFIKIGASPSFIKRIHEVTSIRSACLPIGILSQLEVETTEYQLDEGDMVIMLSDGVMEAARHGRKQDQWTLQTLRRMKETDPHAVAQQLLQAARETSGYHLQDDMTVVAVRLDRKFWLE